MTWSCYHENSSAPWRQFKHPKLAASSTPSVNPNPCLLFIVWRRARARPPPPSSSLQEQRGRRERRREERRAGECGGCSIERKIKEWSALMGVFSLVLPVGFLNEAVIGGNVFAIQRASQLCRHTRKSDVWFLCEVPAGYKQVIYE